MSHDRSRLLVVSALAAAAALVVMGVLAGCSGSGGAVASGPTALGSLSAAESALATSAPDARLLMVQTAQSAATTGTPVWAFVFGSPATDMTYLVYTIEGKVMTAGENGQAGLSADQWADVPETAAWKIDSDTAYEKAFAASGGSGTPAGYFMGLITYKSATDTSTVEPFQWNVWIDPGTTGATTSKILVDAKSGKATVSAE